MQSPGEPPLRIRKRSSVLAPAGVLLLVFWTAAQDQETLPKIEGENLAGQKVTLPDAAAGKVAVLVLGFSKASKEPTSAWAKRISADFASQSSFVLYQLPVLQSVPRFVRGMVISSMRKGTPADMREHFVPLLSGEAELKKLVNFEKPDDAYLIVLNESGKIVKQLHGVLTDERYADLRNSLQLAMKSGDRSYSVPSSTIW